MENLIKAEIITHSKRLNTNEELITYKLIYPRIIHSELMTYSMMSVNSASSRAIPVNKLIEVIEKTPFYPISYQKKHSGMQGIDYFTSEEDIKTCHSLWEESMQESIRVAKKMLEFGISKQIINRTLESYQYHCCLFTGTRESFEHLFNQRCPVYPGGYKSWKELCDLDSNYTMETPLIERLKVNKGQAEIHFMDLAEKMYDALNESTPDELSIGSYHIPFYKDIISSEEVLGIENLIAMSVALTARVSYTSIGDNNKLTLERATNIYNHCLENGHWSVFEHIGQCMTDEEYENSIRQIFGQSHGTKGWNKKFKGFKQLRGILELQQGITK
nr:MAG TPA: Thymidylate synthase complementing protein [Caudoviricetes sp.]